jgi:hypothetical protein
MCRKFFKLENKKVFNINNNFNSDNMELKLQDVYLNELTKLIQLSKDSKYEKCSDQSNHLVYTSLILESKMLTFISEFLTYLFDNMEYAEIKKEDKNSKELNKEIINFLEELKKNDITKNENKSKMFDLFIEIRYKVSLFQTNAETKDKTLLK